VSQSDDVVGYAFELMEVVVYGSGLGELKEGTVRLVIIGRSKTGFEG